MEIEAISVMVFFTIIGFLVYLDKKNIEFNHGLIIRRTERGIKFITKIAKKYKKFLLYLGNFIVVFGVIASILGLSYLIYKTFQFETSAGIILPTVGSYQYPGPVFSVPFWYWIIAIFIVVSAHEPMHALFARLEKVKIKNMGVFLFFVLPLGAFADPDEKQMNKLSWLKKLRIYASGSFGNMIIAAIFIILLLCFNFFISSIMSGNGVIFNSTIANTGAAEVGLSGIITEINGITVKSMSDFINAMKNVKPGDVIKIKTAEGIYNIKTTPNPEDSTKPFIGISGPRTFYVYTGLLSNLGVVSDESFYIISWFSGLLGWILIINFGVGLFNLFPIKPLDGGLMFEEILKHYYKRKNVEKVVNCVSLFILFLILFNLFGPILINWLK